MDTNCIFTKLKGVVNNNNLPYRDGLKFSISGIAQNNATAVLGVKCLNQGSKITVSIGSGVIYGTGTADAFVPVEVGPKEFEITPNYGTGYSNHTSLRFCGTGDIVIKGASNLSYLSVNTTVYIKDSNIFERISYIPGMDYLMLTPPDGFEAVDISEVQPSESVKSLLTRHLLDSGMILKSFATIYPELTYLNPEEPSLTDPKELGYFINLTKLYLKNTIGLISKNTIENWIKQYINSGTKTTGTVQYEAIGFTDKFNDVTVPTGVTLTITWDTTQIHVVGTGFDETVTL